MFGYSSRSISVVVIGCALVFAAHLPANLSSAAAQATVSTPASIEPSLYLDLVEDRGNNRLLVQQNVAAFAAVPKRADLFIETVKTARSSQASEKAKSRAIMRIASFCSSDAPSLDLLEKAVEYVPELKRAFLEVNARNNPYFRAGFDKEYGPEYTFVTFIGAARR